MYNAASLHKPKNRPRSIYINILKWFRGFRVKIVNFTSFFCLSILKRAGYKENTTKKK